MSTKPATAPAEEPKVKRVTAAELTRWHTLRSEATELERTAKAKRDEAAKIERQAVADLKATGKAEITRGGWRLTWGFGRLSVSWKDAFIARCGADAAADLVNETKPPRKIQITPPPEN